MAGQGNGWEGHGMCESALRHSSVLVVVSTSITQQQTGPILRIKTNHITALVKTLQNLKKI
jgi:hypothetical protein